MRQLAGALAFVTSLAALLLIGGSGVALFVIENSGERGVGALMAIGSALAFGAVAALLILRDGTFSGAVGRAMAIAAALLGALPVGALSYAAIRFAGFPIASATPLIDWSVLGAGIVLALGTLSILELGHRRSLDRAETSEPPVVVHMQQIRHAQQQLRSVFEADPRTPPTETEEEVRVRRV